MSRSGADRVWAADFTFLSPSPDWYQIGTTLVAETLPDETRDANSENILPEIFR